MTAACFLETADKHVLVSVEKHKTELLAVISETQNIRVKTAQIVAAARVDYDRYALHTLVSR